MWAWFNWIIIRKWRIVVFDNGLLKFLHYFLKSSTINESLREPRAKLDRLITCSTLIIWFDRKNSDIRFDDYCSSSVLNWIKNKLLVFMISKNELVDLINEKSDFLIDKSDENQFDKISVFAFEMMFAKDFVEMKMSAKDFVEMKSFVNNQKNESSDINEHHRNQISREAEIFCRQQKKKDLKTIDKRKTLNAIERTKALMQTDIIGIKIKRIICTKELVQDLNDEVKKFLTGNYIVMMMM